MRLIDADAAIDKIKKRLFETALNNVGIKQNVDETLADVAENRLESWFNELPSVQTDIIRCKDCEYLCDEDGLRGMCWHINGFGDVKDKYNSFCSWAERREDATD